MKKIINTLFIGAMALFTFGACSDVPMPYEIGGGGNEDDGATLLSTTFAGGKGDFSIENKVTPEEMPEIWTTGANYIKATASKYMSDDQTTPTKFDAESWLISPSINLSSVTHATLTFEHAARYFYSDKSGMTVLVSETGTGVWEQVTIPTYPEGTDWTFVSSGDINLDKYIGKQIQIAFKYISTTSTSPTWELKNVLVEAREAEDSGETPSEGTGKGTKDDPYDIAAAKSKQDGKAYWVKAYIIGDVNGQVLAEGAEFVKPFSSKTNILIAAAAGETNVDNCMPVQLPTGDVRNALNLNENESNLGKEVLLYGTFEAYFRVAGVKNVSAASFDGGTTIIGKDPDATEEPKGNLVDKLDTTNPVNEVSLDFSDAIVDTDYEKTGWVNFAEVGERLWQGKENSGEKCIQATAYGSTDASNVSWFVSPAVTVSNMAVKKVTFDCAAAYYTAGATLEVFFLEKNGTTLNQTAINVSNIPGQGSTNYEFVKGLTGDLSSFEGKTGFIGFKYTGNKSAGATGTYQLDNIIIGKEGSEPQPPVIETVKVTKDQAYEESFASNIGKFTINNKTVPTEVPEIWKWNSYKYMQASAYVSSTKTNYASESWLVSPIIDLTSVTKATLVFDHLHQFAGTATDELTLQVTESDKDEWKTITIPTYSTGSDWNFVSSGNIDLSSYAGKSIQFAFKYVSTSSAAATWRIQNVKVSADEGGTVDPTPSGDLISNAGFETWNGATPEWWNSNTSVGNAKVSQSTDAHTGTYALSVKNSSSNTRLAGKPQTYEAGTYEFSFWAKGEGAGIKYGYATVINDKGGTYSYMKDESNKDILITATNSWTKYTGTITITEAHAANQISIIIMSSKSTADFLIDDVTLTKK